MARTPRSAPNSDPDAARTAWEKALLRVLALEPERVMAPPPDPRAVLQSVGSVVTLLSDDAVRARFLKLPKDELDPKHLDDLPVFYLAFVHARGEVESAQSAQVDVNLPEALAQRASDLRGRMQKVVLHYLEDDTEFSIELKTLGKRKHHAGVADDLLRLAKIYEMRRELIEKDPKHYRATDATDARTAAEEVQKILSEARGDAEKVWTDHMQRAWTLLHGAYEEVQAAGLYLYRKDSPEERFPTLQTTRRARGPRQRKDDKGEAGDKPVTPDGA
jgi:hypothetical protein